MSRVPERRYPAQPIVARFRTIDDAAAALQTEPRTVHRWLVEGVSVYKADEIAVKLGENAVDLWPTWFEDGEADTATMPSLIEQGALWEGA